MTEKSFFTLASPRTLKCTCKSPRATKSDGTHRDACQPAVAKPALRQLLSQRPNLHLYCKAVSACAYIVNFQAMVRLLCFCSRYQPCNIVIWLSTARFERSTFLDLVYFFQSSLSRHITRNKKDKLLFCCARCSN